MTQIEIDNIFPNEYKGGAFISDLRILVNNLNDGGHLSGGGGTPVDSYTKTETDALLTTKLNLTGGVLTGDLNIATSRSSRLQVTDGSDSTSITSGKVSIDTDGHTYALDTNTRNNTLNLKIDGISELTVGKGVAPSTPYQPTDINHLTRKDYVDGLLSSGGSGFEKITENGKDGWRLVGVDPLDFDDVGQNAVDASSAVDKIGSSILGATGDYAFCSGADNIASGEGSHAEGRANKASGNYSHAEGYKTIAEYDTSHAEGYETIASGYYSHAEGYTSESSGQSSHAEGFATLSKGNNSHAEGYETESSGNNSHAEGNNTKASGDNTHAEGYETIASGDYSHAEGYETIASGSTSHAEGELTEATGTRSHAEGTNTKALAINSHSEGYYTIALNASSHAAGKYNIGTATDTIHETGIGADDANRANAFEIYTDGRIHAPELTIALHDSLTSLTTKEYVDSTVKSDVADPGDSTATTVAGIVQDYNVLLANLRTAGIIA